MISDAQFVAAFSVIVSTAFTLVIWWWMAGCHADNLRDELFTVRDKMFLYALDRGILGNPAHENLRRLMNSLIRYAHRVSLGRLLLLDLSSRVFKIKSTPPKTYMEWVEAVAALSDDEAECMRDFHAQAMFLMMKHIVSGSPLLWAACVVWAAFHVAVIKSTRVFIDAVVRSVSQRFPSVALFEADALRTM